MKARISSASSPICQFRKRKSNDFDAKGAVERPKNQYGTASGTYDTERYYTFDANQNITAVFDGANGNVLERYVYDPYGAVTVYDSAWANPTAPSDDGPLYAGHYFDAETGLYHVRNRYYDAALGRFISRDHDLRVFRGIFDWSLVTLAPYRRVVLPKIYPTHLV